MLAERRVVLCVVSILEGYSAAGIFVELHIECRW